MKVNFIIVITKPLAQSLGPVSFFVLNLMYFVVVTLYYFDVIHVKRTSSQVLIDVTAIT